MDDQWLRGKVVKGRSDHRLADAHVCYIAGEEFIGAGSWTWDCGETKTRVGVEALCCGLVFHGYRWSSFRQTAWGSFETFFEDMHGQRT